VGEGEEGKEVGGLLFPGKEARGGGGGPRLLWTWDIRDKLSPMGGRKELFQGR